MILDRASRVFLRWAKQIMPAARRAWIDAMIAESFAISSRSERARFAAGCLSFAVSSWAQTRTGLVWIGRSAIAAGLWSIGAVGAFIAPGLQGAPSVTLLIACSIYAIGGGAALHSLGALRKFALLGGAGAACMLAASVGASSYYMAVALEAGALMIALFGAALFLAALRDSPA